MRRLYPAVVLLILASLFGCGGSHSASLTPQSSASGAVPASASRSVSGSALGSAADVSASLQPASVIKVSPVSVAMVTAGQTQTITVSEPGYSGSFTVTTTAPTIATVSPVVSGQATVTAVAQGATSLIVSDQLKHKATVPVSVGLAQLVLQQYRSPATQSIAVNANGQMTYVNLASPPSGCAAFNVSCALSAPEVVGANTFALTLYDGQNGTGNLLSTGAVSAQIASPSSPQKFLVPLGGAVSALTIALGNPTPPPGTPTTSSVNIGAVDPDGNLITGTSSYVNSSGTKLSVSISDSDTSGITSVAPKMVSKPSISPVLSYNGTHLPFGATITAAAPGVSPVSALFAPPNPPGASKIYVINFGNTGPSSVTTYNADGSPSTPTITSGVSSPIGGAVDAAGKIYVGNYNGNSVTTFNADGSPSTPTITGLVGPWGMAVDAAGKIYVTNGGDASGNNGFVATYNADGSTSTPTITGLTAPRGVAVDAAGKIYVAIRGYSGHPGSVMTYNPDGSPSTPTITVGLSLPVGVAVDAAGKIYVTNEGNNTLTTYNPDGSASVPTITTGRAPQYVAVDAAGKIYVTNLVYGGNSGTVTTYNADGSASTPTITGLNTPEGIAVR